MNHASFLDPVLVGCVVPRPIHYMARRTLFKKGPANWLLRYALNCVPVDRGSLRRDTYREVVEILQAGRGCLIFPEGTRSTDGRLKPLKSGVIRLALQGGVPVVPLLYPRIRASAGARESFSASRQGPCRVQRADRFFPRSPRRGKSATSAR